MNLSKLIITTSVVVLAGVAQSDAARVTVIPENTRSATAEEVARVRAREETAPIRNTLTFPARAVSSVIRTPAIIGGTLAGKRELLDPMPTWRKEQLAEGRD
jgi:hypothetical protein